MSNATQMSRSWTSSDHFFGRLIRLAIPTVFVWIVTFEWIARAYPGIQIAARILFILTGGLWLAIRARDSQPLRLTSVGLLLLSFTLYSALLALTAPLQFHALEVQLNYIFYFLAFVFFVNEVNSKGSQNAWLFAFLQLAIIFSFFNLFLVGRWWKAWLDIPDMGSTLPPFGFRLPGLFLQHPNIEAAYLNLVIPFLLIGLISNRPTTKRILGLGGMTLLLVLTSFFASSRGAWLGMAASIATALTLFYWVQIKANLTQLIQRERVRVSRRTITLVSAGLLVVIGIGLLSYQQARFGGHGGRWGVWSIAWAVIKDAPFLGQGPGSFHVLSAVKARIPPGFFLVHAHNLILQIWAEYGLVGLVIFTLIFLQVTKHVFQAWTNRNLEAQALIPYVAGLAGMLAHQLVDFALEAPLYTVAVLFGLAQIARREHTHPQSTRSKSVNWVLILLLLICYIAGSIIAFKGTIEGYKGVLLAQKGEWDSARTHLCQAHEESGWNTLFAFQCGFASAVIDTEQADAQSLEQASTAYSDGLVKDPYWPFHQAAEASISWIRGEHGNALLRMQNAQELAPRSAILSLNLAYYYGELGESNQRQSQIDLAYQLDPWLWMSAQSPWKPTGKALDPTNQQLIERSLPASIFAAWRGWMHLEVNNFENAHRDFETSLELDPACVEAHAGLAELALLEGNLSESQRHAQIADLTGRSSWLLDMVKGNIYAASEMMEQAYTFWLHGTRAYLWTSYSSPYYESVYSRAYIPIDFPPQVIQPPLPPGLMSGYQQALEMGSSSTQMDAVELVPWIEAQIQLTDLGRTAKFGSNHTSIE